MSFESRLKAMEKTVKRARTDEIPSLIIEIKDEAGKTCQRFDLGPPKGIKRKLRNRN